MQDVPSQKHLVPSVKPKLQNDESENPEHIIGHSTHAVLEELIRHFIPSIFRF